MKVKHIGYGILIDDLDNRIICDYDEDGSLHDGITDKSFKITKYDENDDPIEIEWID